MNKIEKINKTKSGIFEKINKINSFGKTQMTKIGTKTEGKTTDLKIKNTMNN